MSPADALTAGLFALPTLAWAVITRQLWLHRRMRPEPSPLFGPAVAATGHGFGFFLPELLLIVELLGASTAVVLGHAAVLAATAPQWHPFVHLAAVLAVALVVVPAQPRLRAWLTRLIFGRSVRQQAELLAFLQRLSPELGTRECCRRALAELVRVRRLPGAAIMFRDGDHMVHGTIHFGPLLAVWPRGQATDALPAHSFGTDEQRRLEPALRDALMAANVGLGAVPILSPRRRWGHLFMNTGIMRGFFRQEDADAFEAFCGQLALVLDAADLLERAVAVERSLAHAEKLATIGETAARIAHDIRNPVTAARSLAQQLARDAAGDREAAAVILDELDRVERRVGSLLRFARRDECRVDRVDLGELVTATIDQSRSRLEGAGIRVTLDAPSGVVVRGDPERLRQALLNLVDDAADAVAQVPRREIAVQLAARNGCATVRVSDTGPGVRADVVPRLFEPFFSLKPQGTGLGLAIVKRTTDAHGGRITAVPQAGGGMAFLLELPVVEAA